MSQARISMYASRCSLVGMKVFQGRGVPDSMLMIFGSDGRVGKRAAYAGIAVCRLLRSAFGETIYVSRG